MTAHRSIPVTSPALTLIDLATSLPDSHLLAAVTEADKLELIDPERLREELDHCPRHAGVARLRRLLDRQTYRMTDSELERRFLPLARRAGLSLPETGASVCGYRVDFHWPDLGLVVETDGLRYHRTPAQQAKDRRRDQTLVAAGLTVVRFTHGQIAFEPGQVEATLRAVARLRAA